MNMFNPLNTELNHIYRLLALVGAHHILHVSRVRVNLHITALTFIGPPSPPPLILYVTFVLC